MAKGNGRILVACALLFFFLINGIAKAEQIGRANFSIEAEKYSSTLKIVNTGEVALTNIKIIKDWEFRELGPRSMKKEVIKIIPVLNVNESVEVPVPPSFGDFLSFYLGKNITTTKEGRLIIPHDKGESVSSNWGWIVITCDQSITKKIVFYELTFPTYKWHEYLTFLDIFIFYILPFVLVIIVIIVAVIYRKKKSREKA